MDLYSLRAPLLILAAISCCSCSVLVPLKISGVNGKYATFPLTIPPSFQPNAVKMYFLSSAGESIPVYNRVGEKVTVPPAYSGRVVYNQTTYELQLGPLTPADAGQYSFVLVDVDFNTNQGQTTLEMLEPVADVADVAIISSLSEAVEFNSTVILTCFAKGSFLSYKWLNGSAPVVGDGKHLVLNGSQLIVTEVLRTDLRGPIYCIAENQLESVKSTAFNLTIAYGPESIALKKVPDDVVLKEGSNLMLLCSAISSPAAELKWLFNGDELPQKGSRLVLTDLGKNQSGKYNCVAYNSKTKRFAASQVATVSVDRENCSSEGPYGLQRRIVSSKRLRDYVLEGETTSEVTGRRRKQAKLQRVATETRGYENHTAERREGEAALQESSIPLLIHGRTIEEYQTIYRSVVESMLSTASGQPCPYSLELGLRIKQRLWNTLRCPTLREEEQPDGQLGVTEGFSTPTLRSFAPLIEVDISGEPVPKHSKRPRQ